VDGLFSDFADTAVAARVLFELERSPDAARCLTGDRGGPKRHQPECPGD
jgi:glycerophosphoryl diester phosphodiesterase